MAEQIQLSLAAYAGIRLDRALAQADDRLSRSQWQSLIRSGQVLVDDKPAKSNLRLTGDETVVATLPQVVEVALVAQDLPLGIVYQDEALIVVDKAAGVVVHPAVGHESGTLVNALLHHVDDLGGISGERRPGIVHRLDKNTSGLMVVAKNDQALHALQQQFKARTVAKRYLALVDGHPSPHAALIDAPIGRDRQQRKRMAVIAPGRSAKARAAQTAFETIETFAEHALLACRPKTGRTHQIRVHLAYIGHPIVGDRIYGRRKQPLLQKRHFLHAAELAFDHPVSGERVSFNAPLPGKLQQLIERLRAEAQL